MSVVYSMALTDDSFWIPMNPIQRQGTEGTEHEIVPQDALSGYNLYLGYAMTRALVCAIKSLFMMCMRGRNQPCYTVVRGLLGSVVLFASGYLAVTLVEETMLAMGFYIPMDGSPLADCLSLFTTDASCAANMVPYLEHGLFDPTNLTNIPL